MSSCSNFSLSKRKRERERKFEGPIVMEKGERHSWRIQSLSWALRRLKTLIDAWYSIRFLGIAHLMGNGCLCGSSRKRRDHECDHLRVLWRSCGRRPFVRISWRISWRIGSNLDTNVDIFFLFSGAIRGVKKRGTLRKNEALIFSAVQMKLLPPSMLASS